MKKASNAPILVTGLHRSGTTWVGRMLAASGAVRYLHEPMNPSDGPRAMRGAVQHAYQYVCDENDAQFSRAIHRMMTLRGRFWSRLQSPRPIADLKRLVAGGTPLWWKSLHLRRHLLKDPFALFSLPWFDQHLQCRVVIAVRRAEGVIGSLKRMKWNFDHRHLLEQPLLMRDWLRPFRRDLEAVAAGPADIIAEGALLWRIGQFVVERYRRECPQFIIVSHEELSQDPIGGFSKLYAQLDLPFTTHVEQRIREHSSAANTEVNPRNAGYVKVNSRANLEQWKRRLTPDEIARIRALTDQDAARPLARQAAWREESAPNGRGG